MCVCACVSACVCVCVRACVCVCVCMRAAYVVRERVARDSIVSRAPALISPPPHTPHPCHHQGTESSCIA